MHNKMVKEVMEFSSKIEEAIDIPQGQLTEEDIILMLKHHLLIVFDIINGNGKRTAEYPKLKACVVNVAETSLF